MNENDKLSKIEDDEKIIKENEVINQIYTENANNLEINLKSMNESIDKNDVKHTNSNNKFYDENNLENKTEKIYSQEEPECQVNISNNKKDCTNDTKNKEIKDIINENNSNSSNEEKKVNGEINNKEESSLKNFYTNESNNTDTSDLSDKAEKCNVYSSSSIKKNYKVLFKIILIGDSGIGKTSIINRYINNYFADKYLCTIGVDFMMKTININNNLIKLQIWDTAGMERYRNITTSYYRGANAAIIAFDLTDHKSFENVSYWLNLYYSYCNQAIAKCLILLGNKSDLNSERTVDKQEIDELLNTNKSIIYYEVSAKTGDMIDTVFNKIADKIYTEITDDKNNDIYDIRPTDSYRSINIVEFKDYINNKKKKKCKC